MNRNNTIDLFRLIAIYCVMSLHTDFTGTAYSAGPIMRLCARWAVPFFFITTGYFIGKKIKEGERLGFKTIEKNLVNLTSIFVVSSLVYLAFNYFVSDSWPANDVGLLVRGTHWHLWFVSSMIFGIMFIWYIASLNYEKLLAPISLMIIAIAVFSDSYDLLIDAVWDYNQLPRFLISIPFMYTGIVMSKRTFSRKSLPIWAIVFVAAFLLQFVETDFFYTEYQYSHYDTSILIGTVVASVALFAVCINTNIKDNFFSQMGRKSSLFIYLYHLIAYWLIAEAVGYFEFEDDYDLKFFVPLIAFLFLLLVAMLLDRFAPRIFAVLNGDLKFTKGNTALTKQ